MAKNTPDLTTMLRPKDRQILDQEGPVSWIPKEPRELLLPYVDENPPPERNSIDYRRQKAKEVYDGYGKIIEECKEIEDEITKQCKNVKIALDPHRNLRVMEAVKRVFGTDGTEITFEMYQTCIKALGAVSGQNIPNPADPTKEKTK